MTTPVLAVMLLVWGAAACTSGESFFIQQVEVPADMPVEEKIELSGRVLPSERQRLWWEDEFLGFIHYGPNTHTGMEWGTGHEDAALFNPGDLDTDQWCSLMEAAGIRRVVMVVKHHEGYNLWQTRYSDHSVAASPWKNGQGDVLRELAESAEKYGLRLGIYLSPADLHEIERPDGLYGNGSEFTMRTIPRPVEGRPFEDSRTFTYELDDYNEYFMNQLFELLTEYGPVYELWFDGAHPKPGTGQVYNEEAWFDMIRQLAPDAVIFGGEDIRWCGNEGGRTREAEYNVLPTPRPHHMADNLAGRDLITEETVAFSYFPAETNTSIRAGWFWRNDHEQQVRSVDDVFDIYERSIGGNSVLHLNIPPNTDGQFSPLDAEVLLELGRRIETVYGTDLLDGARVPVSGVRDGSMDTWWQAPDRQASVEITLPSVQTVNRFMIREAIFDRGERIEAHTLHARVNGSWQPVAEGKTVGNRRILRFPAVEADAFRLEITQARLAPAISHISAHFYDEPPKPVVAGRDVAGQVSMGVGLSFGWKREEVSDLSQPIYYTLDGSDPDVTSLRYEQPFQLPLGGLIRSRAIVEGRPGPMSEMRLGILPAGFTATDSQGRAEEPARVLDDRAGTRWITEPAPGGTHWLVIDMQQVYEVAGFAYVPALPGGYIEGYRVQVSTDGASWQTVQTGRFGNIINDPSERVVFFDAPVSARMIRLDRLVPPGDLERVGASQIRILSEEASIR